MSCELKLSHPANRFKAPEFIHGAGGNFHRYCNPLDLSMESKDVPQVRVSSVRRKELF